MYPQKVLLAGLPLLLRAVLADVSKLTTLKARTYLLLPSFTILDNMPNYTTEVALPLIT